jgi:hypothetical protein
MHAYLPSLQMSPNLVWVSLFSPSRAKGSYPFSFFSLGGHLLFGGEFWPLQIRFTDCLNWILVIDSLTRFIFTPTVQCISVLLKMSNALSVFLQPKSPSQTASPNLQRQLLLNIFFHAFPWFQSCLRRWVVNPNCER